MKAQAIADEHSLLRSDEAGFNQFVDYESANWLIRAVSSRLRP